MMICDFVDSGRLKTYCLTITIGNGVLGGFIVFLGRIGQLVHDFLINFGLFWQRLAFKHPTPLNNIVSRNPSFDFIHCQCPAPIDCNCIFCFFTPASDFPIFPCAFVNFLIPIVFRNISGSNVFFSFSYSLLIVIKTMGLSVFNSCASYFRLFRQTH